MPVVVDKNRITDEKTKVYAISPIVERGDDGHFCYCGHGVFGDTGGGEWLLEQRKQEATAHQEMTALQKVCAKSGDHDTARFFKDEANFHRRRYNALLWIIPHFVIDPPGDCKPLTEPWYWPLDLADEFDAILAHRKLHS